jgi:NAD(P)-dependent dehydrogenase (short-subunit alcohol dehydrogenase family)
MAGVMRLAWNVPMKTGTRAWRCWLDNLPGTAERRKSVPMERYGTAEEIASVIAFLAGAGAGYITGQNLRVDGGVTSSV